MLYRFLQCLVVAVNAKIDGIGASRLNAEQPIRVTLVAGNCTNNQVESAFPAGGVR